MKDEDKTKQQLIAELDEIRQRTEVLEIERKRLFRILDELPAQVYLTAPDHTFRYSNRLFQECFGNPDRKPCYMVFHGRTEPCERCHAFRPGESIIYEQVEYSYPDGNTYRNYDYPFNDVDGTELLLSLGLDITMQKKAEAALLQSEEKFSKAFHFNPDPMSITTLQDGRYVEVNEAYWRATGYEQNEIVGQTSYELGIWNNPENRDFLLKQIQEHGSIEGFESELRIKSGEVRTFIIAGEIIYVDSEPYLLCSIRDITENKRMEGALRQSEECFSKAFNSSPIPMAISTLEEGEFIMVNNTFCRILGYSNEDVIGRTSLDIGFWANYSDRYLAKQRIMANQTVRDMEISFCSSNGEHRVGLYSAEGIDINCRPCLLNVLIDITELRQMEVEMTRLDRLNLVGEMAASIGHEIRNPMTTVRGYLQLLQENEDYHKEIEYFDLMIEELDRANLIITEFLSLAKNKMVELKPNNLNAIISKLLPLVQAKAISRDQHIKVELNYLPDILLDSKEIRQLILNLVNNGMESMASAGGVTIRTFIEKEKVVLAVQDQGHGINLELLDMLGTPFFTTKEQGTGLGLAVCYRIAARHNAKINFDTSSSGTTFYIEFPSPFMAATGL